MGTPSLWDKVRMLIGDIAWRVFLWSIRMSQDEYIALLVGLDKVIAEEKLAEVLSVAETMANAIRVWSQAKKDRESWKPVPGQIPPEKYLRDAKQANLLLENALQEYEFALVGEPNILSDSPKSI